MEERFGFIHDKLDIKILILYILQRIPEPISIDILAEQTLCDDGICYFDFAECVAELKKTGHIVETDDKFLITEKGRRNGKITETGLPYSVRLKVDKSVAKLLKVLKRNSAITTSRTQKGRGSYLVTLTISDGIGQIFTADVLAGSEEQAEKLEKSFRAKAELAYKNFMDTLTEDQM